MYFTSAACSAINTQQPLRHFVGIAVQEPHPFLMRRRNLRQPRQQLRQAVFQSEILAVTGGVLADQVDLANTLRKQPRRFADHRFEPAAAKLSAILRDHAEGAGMIATLGDFDVCEMFRRRQHARRQVVIQILLEWICSGRGRHAFAQLRDPLQLIRPDHRIDLGHVLLNVGAITFHQTTRDDQALRAPGLLVLRHFENGVDRFLLRRIDKAARVDHDHIGVGWMRRQLMTRRGELAHHHLRIDEVLRASKTDKTNFQLLLVSIKCGSAKARAFPDTAGDNLRRARRSSPARSPSQSGD